MRFRFFSILCGIYIVLFVFGNTCEPLHYFDLSVTVDDEEPNDDYLYELGLGNYCNGVQLESHNYIQAHPPEYYLQKAMKAYDTYKYEKCIEYTKSYEREINRPGRISTLEEKVLGLCYKAYSKKYLKKYDTAIEFFEEIIELMKKGEYEPECLFTVYLQHASCYAGLGKKEKCQEKIKKLVNLNIGPSLQELQNNNYYVNQQPCFHHHILKNLDKMIINEIVASALGQNVLALQQQKEPVPHTCICCKTNEDPESCNKICRRMCGYAAVATAFIPNRIIQAAVLLALIEFEMECIECCQNGLGSTSCCEYLKIAIQSALGDTNMENL